MHTFFMNADQPVRADENIERMEVVRGAGLRACSAPTRGAIVNSSTPPAAAPRRRDQDDRGQRRARPHRLNLNGPLSDHWRSASAASTATTRHPRSGLPGNPPAGSSRQYHAAARHRYFRGSTKIIDDRNQFILRCRSWTPRTPAPPGSASTVR